MTSSISTFQQTFELAPIIFNQGFAANYPGAALTIVEMIETAGIGGLEYGDYFAHFKVMPGGTLIDYQFAEYPFASLEVAANAVVQQPLKVSMLMICPAQTTTTNNYNTKLNTLTLLADRIQSHIQAGGYFTVMTPGYVYSDVLLKTIRDVTPAGDKQVQAIWQWDFEQPLIAVEDANTNVSATLQGFVTGKTTDPTNWGNAGAAG